MAQFTKARKNEIIRAALQSLAAGPLLADDVVAQSRSHLELSAYERGNYPSGHPRFPWLVKFSTIRAVKAGWLRKDSGTWSLTAQGLTALTQFPTLDEFGRELSRLYREWKASRPRPDDDDDDEQFDEPTVWDVSDEVAIQIRESGLETPKANADGLLELVRQAGAGRVVLPEFQRSFVWGREDIEQLIASLLRNYFVGTFLLLDTPSHKPMFPFRPVEGYEAFGGTRQTPATVRLVLDGQQRISSLFYALYQPGIPLKGAQHPHRFFLDLERALGDDIDDAVVGVSENDRRGLQKYRRLVDVWRALPLSDFADPGRFYKWLNDDENRWSDDAKLTIEALHKNLTHYLVPTITLHEEAGRENVVNIFELINRTGISLSLFDLAAARLYIKHVLLRDLWQSFRAARPASEGLVRSDFLLKLVMLLSNRPKETRKGNILESLEALEKEDFDRLWGDATQALDAAMHRLRSLYGAFRNDLVPYSTMLVPLAALLHLAKTKKVDEQGFRRLDRWYWTSVFTQRYDSAVDTKTFQDFRDIGEWMVQGGNAPSGMPGEFARPDLTGTEQRSAIYRGVLCLIVRRGAFDFRTGQPAPLNQCQDDHVFPRSIWKSASVESVLNRTLIAMETNNWKANVRPSKFLAMCLESHGGDDARLMATLSTHYIDEMCVQAMRADNLDAFELGRKRLLAAEIEELVLGVGSQMPPAMKLPQLLKRPEGSDLEFKSTLRWDLKTMAANKDLERAVAKTVASFMNSGGGTLVIGVTDDRKVLGIEEDYRTLGARSDVDGWEQALRNGLHAYLPKDAVAMVASDFFEHDGRTLAVLRVYPAADPVYIKDGSASRFYVRSGNTSQELDGNAIAAWTRKHFS